MTTTEYACGLDLPRRTEASFVAIGQARAIEVLAETPRAVLLLLFPQSGQPIEAWFPLSALRLGWDGDTQEAVFGPGLYASRRIIHQKSLWRFVEGG